MAVEKDKKTGKWFYYGRYPKTHPKAGKQYKKRGFSSAKKAEKAEQIFRDGFSDVKTEIADMTFEELTEHYLEYAVNKKKESSLKNDESTFRSINKRLGKIKLAHFNQIVLQDYVDYLGENYAYGTMNNFYASLNKLFKYAIKQDWIKENLMSKIEKPKKKEVIKVEDNFWTPEQFGIFIRYVDNFKWRTIFIVFFFMGFRVGELCGLSPRDVVFMLKYIDINKQYNRVVYKRTTPKSENSLRKVGTPQIVLDTLDEYMTRMEIFGVFDRNSEEQYLFGVTHPIYRDSIAYHLKHYIEIANKNSEIKIPEITLHGFRHSHASYLINNMSDVFTPYDIAKRLGMTVQTLLKTYAHWFRDADKKVVAMIDNHTQQENTLREPKNEDLAHVNSNDNNYINELKGLKELVDIGIITLDEFNLKKKVLLGI